MEVFFFFLKQTKLNYRLLEGAPAAGLWGSVPRALFSLPLFFFSASPAISVQVLCSFNDGLKSESGAGERGGGGGRSGPQTGKLHPWKVTLAADTEPLQKARCQAALGKGIFHPSERSTG